MEDDLVNLTAAANYREYCRIDEVNRCMPLLMANPLMRSTAMADLAAVAICWVGYDRSDVSTCMTAVIFDRGLLRLDVSWIREHSIGLDIDGHAYMQEHATDFVVSTAVTVAD